jgi:exodeoxyribonuclease V beta subunit
MNRFSAIDVPARGSVLVEASAGTGKTYAICTLFVRLLLERRLAVDQILVVTFTEAATAELRGRLRGRLRAALAVFDHVLAGEATDGLDPELTALARRSADATGDRHHLASALSSMDEAAVSTIHGFCHRVLAESAFESGTDFEPELITDAQSLRDEVILDFWARTLADGDPRQVRALRAEKVTPSSCRRLADAVIRSPEMRVLPPVVALAEPPGAEDLSAIVEAMRQSYARAELLGLLQTEALKANIYRAPSFAGWLDAAESFLAGAGDVVPTPQKWMEMLSTSKLARSTKKAFVGIQPRHAFFGACEQLLERARAMGAWSRDYALWFRLELARAIRDELPARKRQLGVLTFDDLLLRVHDALGGTDGALAGAIRRRHPVALVDEFQDTDPVQYRIFERIWPDGTRFFIGDPKQAIYAFRGADVFAYLRAAEALDDEQRYSMATNWRSDPALLRGVRTLYQRQASPFLMRGVDFVDVSPRPEAADAFAADEGSAPLSLLFVPRGDDKNADPSRVPELVAADIARLIDGSAELDGRPITPGDVAVLTRKNREAIVVQGALRALGIPSVVLGDQSVFEADHPEARELELVLSAIAEPTRSDHLRAALTTELVGLSASDLCRLDDDGEAQTDWDGWVSRFRMLHRRWVERGFIQMIHALLDQADVEARLLALAGGERRMTNLRHLIELLHTAATTEHLGPSALLAWFAMQRDPATSRARPESAQVRLESDDRAVKITTVHRSKGLEYPIVYCPYLWDGLLVFGDELRALEVHDAEGAAICLAAEKDGPEYQRAQWERLAEAARLTYVALTRARHRCVVVWGGFQRFETSALGYLLHVSAPLGPTPAVSEVKAQLKGLGDARMLADLRALADSSEGAIEVRDASAAAANIARVESPAAAASSLKARFVAEPVQQWWRTASFSELAARRGEGEGRDHDELTPALSIDLLEQTAGRPTTLSDFPRGPEAGNFFHALLEEIDFESLDERRGERLLFIEDKLRAHGLEGEGRAATVSRALDEMLATSIEPGSRRRRFMLRDVAASSRWAELEFFLPVASAQRVVVPRGMQLALSFSSEESVDGVGALTARRLAEAFADHPSKTLDAGYAERVGKLDFIPLEGYLKGYIDLVMVVDDRWYVVDYKSNHLGDRLGDYAMPQLMAAMSHGHYYLQSHLYALAVHRHLGRRLRGYRYDKQFGGVLYLFLKGMQPGSRQGVFFDKPPLARLQALSDVLERPPPRGRRR